MVGEVGSWSRRITPGRRRGGGRLSHRQGTTRPRPSRPVHRVPLTSFPVSSLPKLLTFRPRTSDGGGLWYTVSGNLGPSRRSVDRIWVGPRPGRPSESLTGMVVVRRVLPFPNHRRLDTRSVTHHPVGPVVHTERPEVQRSELRVQGSGGKSSVVRQPTTRGF